MEHEHVNGSPEPAVVVSACFTPAPGRRSPLETVLRSFLPEVHNEAGCTRYALHDAEDGAFVILESWASREALQAHSDGPVVEALTAALEGLLAGPPVVTSMRPVIAGQATKGRI